MTDISKLADDIMGLINSKPRSPLKSEIEAVLQAGIKPASHDLVFHYDGTTVGTVGGITWNGATTTVIIDPAGGISAHPGTASGGSSGHALTFDPNYRASQEQLEAAWAEGVERELRETREMRKLMLDAGMLEEFPGFLKQNATD